MNEEQMQVVEGMVLDHANTILKGFADLETTNQVKLILLTTLVHQLEQAKDLYK